MYNLNDTLIFTSLTHASAAADLFGEDALDTWNHIEGRWDKYFTAICMDEQGAEVHDVAQWRIILDTPEKVGWFEPQVGDDIDSDFFRSGKLYNGIGRIIRKEYDSKLYYVKFGAHKAFVSPHVYRGNRVIKIKRIIQRKGEPFPQPQEVIKAGESI